MEKKKSPFAVVSVDLLLILLLAAAVVLAVCCGKYEITASQCIRIIMSGITGKDSGLPEMMENVVFRLRMPRILAAIIVGAGLSLSGTAYQGVFKNPLIAPDFLGVSSGACIGAAVAILLSMGGGSIQLFAFIGGIAAVALTMTIPVLIGENSNLTLVLSGIIVGAAMSSVLGFIKFVADPSTQLAAITYWTMGSFSYISMADIFSVLPLMIVSAVILMLISWWIDVLSMGESEARTLGANVTLLRNIVIICATLLTASSVCLSGTISWVGLVIPHLARMMVGPENTRLMPTSAILGGLFMLTVDTVTRVIGVIEMPVSILTGIIGAPFYVWLLVRQRRSER